MRKIILAAVAVLAAANFASAAVLIAEPLVLNVGETGTLSIAITGGETISGAQTFVLIGNPAAIGGTDTAPPAPQFVGGDLGSMWAGKNAPNQYDNSIDPLIASNVANPPAGTTAVANGQLFVFQVKANEMGTWPVTISLDNTIILGATAVTAIDGLITVVPEPAAIALLGLGGLFLRRRHA
jgi:hypothetical protein